MLPNGRDFSDYVIELGMSLKDALDKIERNKHEFLIVMDKSGKVTGTLSVGDLVRAVLKNSSLETSIDCAYKRDFRYLVKKSGVDDIIREFKNPKIRFLPIITERGKLYNLITKQQFHEYMMGDYRFDLGFNFFSLDRNTVDYEVYGRPWGYYKTTFLNKATRAKIINLFPGEEISLQEHKKRDEHWVIIQGEGVVRIKDYEKRVSPGDYIHIPRGEKHRIKNISESDSLMISEVQLGEYFGEDDIIRHQDKYGRH